MSPTSLPCVVRPENSGLTPLLRNEFWQVVEDCLVEIHGRARTEAIVLSLDLRRTYESDPERYGADLIYHDEPFYVACDLAGLHEIPKQHLLLERMSDVHNAILSRHDR